ncbi:MAG: acyl dehydratase [Myxococcales bacterium]|nr:acyl dehydratase [Myxococcales bacterium]
MTEFPTPPNIPLWKTAIKRSTGTVVPRIEARARSLPGDAESYAAVCGIQLGDELPVCFPDLLCRGLQLAVLTSPAFPIGLLGIVHVRQRIEQHRPIGRNEALSGHVWVDGSRPARSGGEFDLHTVIRAGGHAGSHDSEQHRSGTGTEVWHGVTTILSRRLPKLPGPEMPGRTLPEQRPAHVDPFVADQSAIWSLPEDLGRRYAKVSGDVNPIHQYAWTARLFGFKQAIIHGWWTLARCLAELEPPTPTDRSPLGARPVGITVEARFLSPMFLPSIATFSAGPEAGSDDKRGFALRVDDRLAVIGTVSAAPRTQRAP